MMGLKVGEYYKITCAEIMMKGDGGIYHIPVFNHLHADPQFGFHQKHYHIDGRFYVHPRIIHQFSIKDGYPAAVIVREYGGTYTFVRVIVKEIQCVRVETGLMIPDSPTKEQKPKVDLYDRWYQGFVGQICAGRKCPHLGTDMLEKDGKLVCPMHNLMADMQSLKIIKRLCCD
jgi:hypothetical protein